MFHGVTKSGSPTPREMASFITETMSKNFLMPLGSSFAARSFTNFLIAPALTAVCSACRHRCPA